MSPGVKHVYDEEITALLSAGKTVAHVARTLGLSRQMVYAARKRLGLDHDARLRHPSPPPEDSTPTPPPPPPSPEVTKGLAVWWSIALDTTAPPAARVNAVDKLREIGAWDQILSRQETLLPPPLDAQDLCNRAVDLLEGLPSEVLEAVLERVPPALLSKALRAQRRSVREASDPAPTQSDPAPEPAEPS